MKLSESECAQRIGNAEFGVLGTVDAERGTHLVPVVYIVRDNEIVVPIDTIKPKSSTSLRRTVNLEADPRSSLLVDHRSSDWRELWWVRADLRFIREDEFSQHHADSLVAKYPHYAMPGSIGSVLRFAIESFRGWSASQGLP